MTHKAHHFIISLISAPLLFAISKPLWDASLLTKGFDAAVLAALGAITLAIAIMCSFYVFGVLVVVILAGFNEVYRD